MKFKLRPKRKHRNQVNNIKKFNTKALQDSRFRERFQERLQQELQRRQPTLSVQDDWNRLKEAIVTTCKETIGLNKKKHQDWFDENDETIKDLIDKKRQAFVTLQNDQQQFIAKRRNYQECIAAVQRVTRRLKNQWWKDKFREIQQLADAIYIRGFFNATKAIFGPSTHGTALLKSKDGTTILKSRAEIGERWKEHFAGLFNQKVTIDRSIIDSIPRQPTDEIQHRPKCAGSAFGRLRERVLQERDIRTDTKMMVYKAVVIPTLLYASETWTPYHHHLKTLEKFHQRCLRSILKIS